jgi:hypothetical protein
MDEKRCRCFRGGSHELDKGHHRRRSVRSCTQLYCTTLIYNTHCRCLAEIFNDVRGHDPPTHCVQCVRYKSARPHLVCSKLRLRDAQDLPHTQSVIVSTKCIFPKTCIFSYTSSHLYAANTTAGTTLSNGSKIL